MKNKTKTSTSIIFFGLIIFMLGCSNSNLNEKITFLERRVIDMEDTLTNGKKIEGDAHGGKFFSRTDSVYGCGTYFKIQDSLLQKDIRIKMNAWTRIGDLLKKKNFAVSLEDASGKIIYWDAMDFKNHITETNKWTNVIDSITIPAKFINSTGLFIKTYSFNPEGHSTLDCDDVELTFYKVEK